MKYIITQEQNDRLHIKRRLPEIMEFIRELEVYKKPCGAPDSKIYPKILKRFFFGNLRLNYDLRSKLIREKDFAWNLIMGYYGDEIINNYIDNCKEKESINESVIPANIRRRADREILEIFINDGIINYPTLCTDFDDGYEYADNVIDYAVDNILWSIDDDVEEKDYYSDALDFLRSRCRQLFKDKLIEDYNFTCIENQ